MSLEAVNLIITIVSMSLAAGGSVMYMRTKISVLESDLITLKNDTGDAIESSYNKLQIYIKKIEESLGSIKTEISKTESVLEKELDNKIENSKNEFSLNLNRLEMTINGIGKSLDKFKDSIYGKYDVLKDNSGNLIVEVEIIKNKINRLITDYDIFIKKDIFEEKEKMVNDKIIDIKTYVNDCKDKIDKIESILINHKKGYR